MPYVDRDLQGNITGIYECAQREGQEFAEAAVLYVSFATLKAAELAAIHETFEQTINRLMGIAARLARSGDTPNALTCDSAVRALIALPNTAAVLAAGDLAALKLAVKSEYAKAVALLSLVAKTEFRSMG